MRLLVFQKIHVIWSYGFTKKYSFSRVIEFVSRSVVDCRLEIAGVISAALGQLKLMASELLFRFDGWTVV